MKTEKESGAGSDELAAEGHRATGGTPAAIVVLAEKTGASGSPSAALKGLEPEYDNEDFICFIRQNWGTPQIPPDKVDYVDKYTFVGGVCRNVRYGDAAKWLKKKTVHGRIVDNEATMDEIAHIMGRNPESPENIAAAIHTMTPEKILAILGPEQAKALAKSILGAHVQ
jgi:hypothetical protein